MLKVAHNSLRSLARLALTLSLTAATACEFSEGGKSCPSGPGIQSVPYSGANLATSQLAFTFSGGPADATSAIGDVLFANKIQGTFFVAGKNVPAYDGVLTSLKAEGHLVANETYSETGLASARDPEREVRKTDQLILPYVTGNIFLLRTPDGPNLPADVARTLNNVGLSRYVGPVGWDIGDATSGVQTDNDCWASGASVASCAAGYLTGIRAVGHGIILMHSSDSQTAALLRLIIPQLIQEKFSFVRLDAIPEIGQALGQASATVGTSGGEAGCSEY